MTRKRRNHELAISAVVGAFDASLGLASLPPSISTSAAAASSSADLNVYTLDSALAHGCA